MSASFAYEDPYLRAQQEQGMSAPQKASKVLKEMGRNAYSSGKGFAKVGMLFASLECVIEGVRSFPSVRIQIYLSVCTQYRAKNDIWNSVSAGFLSGGILARASGPKAAFGGGLAFAAFSAAIDLWLRKEPAEYVFLHFQSCRFLLVYSDD